MTNEVGNPAWTERSRRMRTQVEWNVEMSGGRIPAGRTSASTRCRISAAALFVNVTAMTERGFTPSTPRRYAMRWAMTRVLPLPAPARTSTGPLVVVTASRWGAFRGRSSDSAVTSERNMGTYDTTGETTGLRG